MSGGMGQVVRHTQQVCAGAMISVKTFACFTYHRIQSGCAYKWESSERRCGLLRATHLETRLPTPQPCAFPTTSVLGGFLDWAHQEEVGQAAMEDLQPRLCFCLHLFVSADCVGGGGGHGLRGQMCQIWRQK